MDAKARKSANFRRWYDKHRRAAETRYGLPIEVRFHRNVMPVTESGCWLWTGSWSRGYGQLSCKPGHAPYKAHRLSWELHRGPVPEGLFVCHKCDTPACVNPDHLFLGSAKDNSQDASRKHRVGGTYRRRLTDEQIAEIRHAYKPGRGSPTSSRRLGKIYGVSGSAILKVVSTPILPADQAADVLRWAGIPH